MKKPVVDYRTFRLSQINDPQFSHLKLLLSWPVFIAFYFLTEKFIPAENCYVVHSPLDDLIPFCEVFFIPYAFWYLLLIGSLLYFLLYNVDSFKKLQTFIIITQITAMIIYILFPNRQDMRPTEFPRVNFLTQGIEFLYFTDTNTNVCPSLHVAYSIGIASVWVKESGVPKPLKAFMIIAAILICMSTVFIKQHSVIDIIMAIPVCLLAEYIVFGKSYWRYQLKPSAVCH